MVVGQGRGGGRCPLDLMLLMRWRHLLGGSVSTLEATQRLTSFVSEHLSHRPYAADWGVTAQRS